MNTKITTPEEHQRALERIKELWCSDNDTPEGRELNELAEQVVAYENEHFPIPLPTVRGALAFRIDQQGVDIEQLAQDLGEDGQIAMQMMAGLVPLTHEMASRIAARMELDISGLEKLE